MIPRRVVRLLASATLLLVSALPAFADVDVRIDVGHGGRWIDQCATPVTVTLTNGGADPVGVSLSLSEKESNSTGPMRYERRVFLAAGATRREPFVIPSPEAFEGSLRLEVVTEPSTPIVYSGRIASRGRMSIEVEATRTVARSVVPYAGRVVAVLGDRSSVLVSRLPNAVREELLRFGSDLATVDALPVREADLALAPFVLDGFDALVVIDPDESVLADRGTLDAVLDWVALGGLLVVSPGEHSAALGATPLGPFLPAIGRPGTPLDSRGVLTRVTAELREKTEQPPARRPLAALTLAPARGVPQIAEGRALWADRPLGAGRVRLLAVDAREALRAATDAGHLLALAHALTGRAAAVRDSKLLEEIQSLSWGSHVDIESAVENVLRQDAFDPPSVFVILGLLALYVLIVGPVDWLVLRRLGRQRLTTFTFGGAVLAFTVIAYSASFLVFSAGQVVNRIVLVDLQDGGRDGRQLIRVHDFVGYYSPRGADQDVAYTLPSVVLGRSLPGGGSAAEVGTAYPVLIGGSDPLAPAARIQVAFRSQRVVRTLAAGPTGRTIETSWVEAEDGGRPRLRIANGLPVALESCVVLAPGGGAYRTAKMEPGAERTLVWENVTSTPGANRSSEAVVARDPTANHVHEFLAFLSRLSPTGFDGQPVTAESAPVVSLQRQAALTRTGLSRGAALGRGNALLLARTERAPLPLPVDSGDGRTHVLIRKEIRHP